MKNRALKRIIAVVLCLVVFAGSELTGMTNIVGDLFAEEMDVEDVKEKEPDVQTDETGVETSAEESGGTETAAVESVVEIVVGEEEEASEEGSGDPDIETTDTEDKKPSEDTETDVPVRETEEEQKESSDTEEADNDPSDKAEEATEDPGNKEEVTAVPGEEPEGTVEDPDVEKEAGSPEAGEELAENEILTAEEAGDEEEKAGEGPTEFEAYEDDQVQILVTAEEGAFPAGTELSVKPVAQRDPEGLEDEEEIREVEELIRKYGEVRQELESYAAEDETKEIGGFLAYDIGFYQTAEDRDAQEVKPDGNVSVTVAFAESYIPEELAEDASVQIDSIALVHMKETEEGLEAEALTDARIDVQEDAKVKTAEFESDDFSVFTLVWIKKAEPAAQILTYEDDTVKISVEEGEEGSIPQGVALDVVPVVKENEKTKEQYTNIEERLQESTAEELREVAGFLAYDLSLVSDGHTAVEPGGKVKVTMEYKEAVLPEEAAAGETTGASAALSVQMMSLKEDEEAPVSALSEDDQVETLDLSKEQKIEKTQFVTSSFEPVFLTVWSREAQYSVRIEDSIIEDGTLKAVIYPEPAETSPVHCVWYKRVEGGEFEKVERKKHGEEFNLAEDGTWLNVVLDGGALNKDQTSVEYRVAIVAGDGETDEESLASSESFSIPYWDELQNGSFEEPPLSAGQRQSWNSSGYCFRNGVDGLVWLTTGVGTENHTGHDIEIIDVETLYKDKSPGLLAVSSGYNWIGNAEVPDGMRFAELNAEAAGSLYQDVLTMPGEKLNYWLNHRARGNERSYEAEHDTMYVVIVPTLLAQKGIDERGEITTQTQVRDLMELKKNPDKAPEEIQELLKGVFVKEYTSDDQSWHYYEGTYIPTSYATRFFFVAGNTATGGPTEGNFLDAVGFSQQLPPPAPDRFDLQISKTIKGLELDGIKPEGLSAEQQSAEIGEKIKEKLPALQFVITAKKPDGSDATEVALHKKTLKITDDGWSWNLNNDGSYTGTYKYTSQSIPYEASYIYSVTEENKELASYEVDSALNVTGGTVQEDQKSTLVGQGVAASFDFTNTYTLQAKDLKLKKVWYDSENEYATRPESIKIRLELLNENTADESAAESWKAYEVDGSAEIIIKPQPDAGSNSNEWVYTVPDVPLASEYRIEEVDVDKHYTCLEPVILNGDAEASAEITNALKWKMVLQSAVPEEEGKKLVGAVFELKDSEGKLVAKGSSTEQGVIDWKYGPDVRPQNLNGDYTMLQTESASGYMCSSTGWTINFQAGIPAGYTDAENCRKEETGGIVLTFENLPIYTLPSTGGIGTYWYMISGTLLMLAGMLVLYKRKYAGRC